jgi:threonine dehydrogenase-like Zn-dependent dehydrogenase
MNSTVMNQGVVVRNEDGRISVACEAISMPELFDDSLIVEPAYVGICGSDLDQVFAKTDPSFQVEYPHTLGHEWSGTVKQVGKKVTTFKVGDEIIGHGHLGGQRWFGVSTDGAMADHFSVPANMCFKVPNGVTLKQAALIEPLACALQGLRKAGGVDAGHNVTVIGCGAIGLSMIALVKDLGANVIAIDRSELRLQLAKKLGADAVIVHDVREDTIETLNSITFGHRSDLIVEASGNANGQGLTFDLSANNARILFMGITHNLAQEVSLFQIQNKNLTVLSSVGAPAEIWEPALKVVSRTKMDLTPIVSDIFSFVECNQGLLAAKDSSNHAKVLLSPSGK